MNKERDITIEKILKIIDAEVWAYCTGLERRPMPDYGFHSEHVVRCTNKIKEEIKKLLTCEGCIYFVNTRTGSRGGKYGECAKKGKQTVTGRWIMPERWAKNPFCNQGKIAEGRKEEEPDEEH